MANVTTCEPGTDLIRPLKPGRSIMRVTLRQLRFVWCSPALCRPKFNGLIKRRTALAIVYRWTVELAPLGTCGEQQYRRGAMALAAVVPLVESTVLIMETGPLRVLAMSLLGLQPDPWHLHLNTPLIPALGPRVPREPRLVLPATVVKNKNDE